MPPVPVKQPYAFLSTRPVTLWGGGGASYICIDLIIEEKWRIKKKGDNNNIV